jgi:hypothetical protein
MEATGFERWSFISVNDGFTYGLNGGPAIAAYVANEWYLTVVTKPVGNGQPQRSHIMPFSTGIWSHNTPGNANDGSIAHTALHFGFGLNTDFHHRGEIAAASVWHEVELTDAECETLDPGLLNWLALSPNGLWAFNQEDVGDPVLDLTGNGADQIAITGTSVLTGDDPPGFSFDLGGGPSTFYRDGGVWVPTTRQVRVGGAWVAL